MNIVLLGAPGAGKGTQAKQIALWLKIPHISTGDMLREAIEKKSRLGEEVKGYLAKGQLVPDGLVVELVKERLTKEDCVEGAVLDGYPRTVAQAEMLDNTLRQMGRAIDRVLYFDVADDVVVDRIINRRICGKCGAIYNLKFSPPKEGKCDCGSDDFTIRKDDNEETVRARLDTYSFQTAPLIEFYDRSNVLSNIDSALPSQQVFCKVQDVLEPLIK